MSKLTCEEFSSLLSETPNDQKCVLDVRTPEEFSSGHLPDAVNVPLNDLPNALAHIPKDKKLFIYCKAGGRAIRSYDFLQSRGFSKMFCAADGGYENLKDVLK